MLNLFDQPWTLLIVAIAIFVVTLIIRRIVPDRCPWWQLLLPVFLAVAAFGLDWLVETDSEKIKKLIDTGITAVEERNLQGIEVIIAANYRDSHHKTKKALMRYCKSLLSQPLVERYKKTSMVMQKSDTNATAFLTSIIHFDQQSYVYQNYKSFILIKVRLDLQKQNNKGWLINRVEILEIDRQRVKWKNIKYAP